MKDSETGHAPVPPLTPVDATVGADTEAFWRMRQHGASGHPVKGPSRTRTPRTLPGAALADSHRQIMRQPGRAAGGRRFK